ncbi:MAG: hypothetical protein PHO64_04100 [Thiomonas sp.]|nr:hypothetical protein [Thiomonas sp.]
MIDLLEPVEIDEGQHHALLLPPRLGQQAWQLFFEPAAVEQAGQRIEQVVL